LGLSPAHDYVHRPEELANVNLYEWIWCYKWEKLPKGKHNSNGTNEDETSVLVNHLHNGSISLELEELDVISEYSVNQDEKKPMQHSNGLLHFQVEYPLSDSHGIRYIAKNATHVPNFVDANLPRCDQGDWEYYCCTMIVLFKPWRQESDLKATDRLWDEEFREQSFSEEENRYMCNFNVRYECLDARDDYRAQLKKVGDAIIGS